MGKLQKHMPCPQGEFDVRRLCIGKALPAGDIKTVYARINGKWKRVGWLCLHCYRFQPDKTQIRPARHTTPNYIYSSIV